MDVADLVRQHYGGVDLVAGILDGLTAAGVDVDHLTVDDLSAVDQLHAGFAEATPLSPEPASASVPRLAPAGCRLWHRWAGPVGRR